MNGIMRRILALCFYGFMAYAMLQPAPTVITAVLFLAVIAFTEIAFVQRVD